MNEREVVWREYGETLIHPLALTFTLAMGLWLLVVRRERAVLPIALVATMIPVTQRLVVATLDFDMSRILILFGWSRIFLRGEFRQFRFHRLDIVLLLWLIVGTITHVTRVGDMGGLIYRLGQMFDACGIYFLLRLCLRSAADVSRALQALAAIGCIVGACMILESMTARNLFYIFGGVPEHTWVRDGRLRCTGAFNHPLMAGSFGASLAPSMLMLYFGIKKNRVRFALGFVAATVIVATCSSSGPALAYLAGLFGCSLWVLRSWMRPVMTTTALTLLVVHLVREKPVWHLIGRASDLIGGTGYHRVRLINAFFDNWPEWLAVGVNSTAHWGWGLQDVTNQFILEGVRGGLVTLIAFLFLLGTAFGSVGRVRKRAAAMAHLSKPESRALQMLAWGLGAALAAHCVSWISVSYFGQMRILLYMLYAFIVAVDLTPELSRKAARQAAF